VTNWFDGTVSQYTVGADGTLAPLSMPTVAAGTGPSPSRSTPWASTPMCKLLQQQRFAVHDRCTRRPLAHDPATAPGVTEPSSVTVDPSGRFVYVTNYGTGRVASDVSQYRIGTNGSLTQITTLRVGAGMNPVSVTVHPSGADVYVANSARESVMPGGYVTHFTIGADGRLSNVGYTMAVR